MLNFIIGCFVGGVLGFLMCGLLCVAGEKDKENSDGRRD